MKVIIDIPEEVYKKAKETHDVMCNKVWLGIKYGTPLDDVMEAIGEAYTNTHYMHPEYASGLSYAYGIIDKCLRKAERCARKAESEETE